MKRRQRGFILLTVVVLLAVSTMLLTRTAVVSLRIASEAVQSERELHDRWAELSIRRASLDLADELLQKASETPTTGDGSPSQVLWKDVRLSKQTWRVLIGDESAKINLHAIEQKLGTQMASEIVEKLPVDGGSIELIRRDGDRGKRWTSWLLIDGTANPSASRIARATERLTLWGDGRVNVRRCDEATLETIWGAILSRPLPAKAHELRRDRPFENIDGFLTALDVRGSQRERIRPWLTLRSSCTSVWTLSRSTYREQATLFVQWRGNPQQAVSDRGYAY